MDDAMVIGAQALQRGMERLTAISQNLANATTPGYRRTVPVTRAFDAAWAAAQQTGQAAAAQPMAADAMRVDATPGAPVATGRPLDVAIDGEDWFEFTGRAGVGYSRLGNLRLAADGTLVNEQGQALSGVGGPIVVDGPVFSISPNGEVLQRGRTVGRIKTVLLPRGRLERGDDGLLKSSAADAGAPAEGTRLKVGHLEGSNVAVAREMVQLMQGLRGFEAMQRVLVSYDEQVSSAIQRLSDF